MAPPTGRAASRPSAATTAEQLTPPTMAAGVVAAAVVVLVLYYMLLYSPLAADAQRERSRATDLRAQAASAQADLRRYNDDVAELERARTRARDLSRVLPDNADIPGFMRNINTLAEASGLQITLIQPQAEHVEEYFARVPVRLEVTGTYLSLARFFRSVSQLPRVINMENIGLEQPAEDNGEVRLKARVLATTFRALTAEEAAPHPAGPNGAAGASAAGGSGARR